MTTNLETESEVVLVVDDEEAIRMVLTEVLVDDGFRTLEASDGKSAMEWIDGGAHIDLLIADMGLPGNMNGRQLADAARHSRPDLKVVYISGYGEDKIMGDGPLKPGEFMLIKPFTGTRLATLIVAILANNKSNSDTEHALTDANSQPRIARQYYSH